MQHYLTFLSLFPIGFQFDEKHIKKFGTDFVLGCRILVSNLEFLDSKALDQVLSIINVTQNEHWQIKNKRFSF